MNPQETAKKLVELYQQYIKANEPWEDDIVKAATMLRQQQTEIEALKEVINDALKSVPAMGEDGEFYHEHHGMDGEYLGFENIPANYVVQEIEEILRKAQEK